MRIEVVQSGGFAGIRRRAVLDTAGRPDAEHLHALAHEVLAAGMAPFSRGTPDGFQFDVTVDDRTARFFAGSSSEAQRQLIQAVLAEEV
jgi:hypothetical protein